MPVRRPKSCESCRKAKARCSLTAPCLRCTRRNTQCNYKPIPPHDRERSRNNGFRSIRPAAGAYSVAGTADDTTLTAIGATSCIEAASEGPVMAALAVATLDKQTVDLNTGSGTTQQHVEWPVAFNISTSTDPEAFGNFAACPSSLGPLSPSWLYDFDQPMATGMLKIPSPPEMFHISQNIGVPRSLTAYSQPNLSLRTRSLQQGSLTAKMVFSRLADYTRMLADGKQLPPFIHCPCALGCSDECPPTSRHQCLPEILAICANLTQMFHSRMPGSHGFVWQQICAHVRQMYVDYESYDELQMLQAMQAAVVYGMVCSQCTGTVPSDDAAWIVDTIETFGEALYDRCPWTLSVDHSCATRNEWVLVESLRRIGCLLYLVDLLFQTDAQSPSSGECPEFVNMPLPCVRELWQPISDREWKKRYQDEKDASKQKGKRGLTFGDLIRLKRSLTQHEIIVGSSESTEELAEWCERADDFSMLLWMALSLEGEGQLK